MFFNFRIVFFLLLLLPYTRVCGTHSALEFKQPALIKAQSALFDMDFKKSLDILQSDPRSNTLEFLYMQYYTMYLQYWVHKPTLDFNEVEKQTTQIAAQISKHKAINPDFFMVYADIKLQSAWLNLSNHAYFKSAKFFKEALSLSQKCRNLFPEYTPILKIEGWLQATAGAIPEPYHLGFKALGIKPDLRGGVDKLHRFCNDNQDLMPPIVKANARFELLYLQIHLLNSPDEALDLSKQFWVAQSNSLTDYMRIVLLNEAGKNKELLYEIRAFKSRYNLVNQYLDLLHGVALVKDAAFKDALPLLQSFLVQNSVVHYNAYARYFLALSLYLSGQKTEGIKTMNQVAKQQNVVYEKDKQAVKDAARFDSNEIDLIKARLFFDGENYESALGVLHSAAQRYGANNVELLYRKGRCYQMLNNLDSALYFFNQTILYGTHSPRYFAAYAALQIAYIYELQNDKARALNSFHSVLNDYTANREYQKSIEQKAKAGIQRLSK